PEPVGRAGGHESILTGGIVLQVNPKPMSSVLHRHYDLVARAHEKVGPRVRRESAASRVDGARRSVRHSAPGDECKVDGLDAHLALAERIEVGAVEVITLQAVE